MHEKKARLDGAFLLLAVYSNANVAFHIVTSQVCRANKDLSIFTRHENTLPNFSRQLLWMKVIYYHNRTKTCHGFHDFFSLTVRFQINRVIRQFVFV